MEQWNGETEMGKKYIKLVLETKCETEIRKELKSNAYKNSTEWAETLFRS